MDFKNLIAIVTGGAQGIGKAFCLALLERGSKVCIADVNEETGRNIANEFSNVYKGNVLFVKCDVSKLNSFKETFKKTIEIFGSVNLLVNNAGIMNEQDWRKVVEINFVGVIHGIQLAFEHMGIDNNGSGGYVINTASNAGLNGFPLGPVYSGCKHGVVGLTRSFGSEFHLKRTGVIVSAICPGPVDTKLYHLFPKLSINEEASNELYNQIKPINPSEVAKALVQLLQDQKNGALLSVTNDGIKYEAY